MGSRKPDFLFTSGSGKRSNKTFAFVLSFAECKRTFTLQTWAEEWSDENDPSPASIRSDRLIWMNKGIIAVSVVVVLLLQVFLRSHPFFCLREFAVLIQMPWSEKFDQDEKKTRLFLIERSAIDLQLITFREMDSTSRCCFSLTDGETLIYVYHQQMKLEAW